MTEREMRFKTELLLKDYRGTVHIGKKIREEDGRLLFEFEDKSYSAEVVFYSYEDGLHCSVSAEATTEISYDRQKTFASIGAVVLKFIPEMTVDCVMGSYYFLKEQNDCRASPFFSKALGEIPERTASVLWKKDEIYYHMLPLCDEDCKSEIAGNGQGLTVSVSPYTGGFTKIKAKTFVIAWGDDPYSLTERTAQLGFCALNLPQALRKDKKLPEVFEYLGWCSWDGFGKDVTAEGVEAKAKEFFEKNIPVKWMLIDDGWFCYDGFLLTDYREDRKKFPDGLSGIVEKLKSLYGIRWVGAWQCFIGYWSGIHPESKMAKEKEFMTFRTNGGAVLPDPEEGKNFEFWNMWNGYLKNSGVDFVKVDVENSLAAYTHGNMSIGKAARGAHTGLEGSVGAFFGGACIHCTGMGHESIWNRHFATVNRNSVDFEPQNPESMRLFVTQNIYNSLYHSQFYYTDWDMMWSESATTKLNVVLHSICGGPVYVSDPIGKSDANVITPFVLPNGRLLKCDRAAVPTKDILFSDTAETPELVKAWSTTGNSGMLGAFNLEHKAMSGTFSPADIPVLDKEEYLVYEWFTKQTEVLKKEDRQEINLEGFDAALYSIVPVISGVALLGLADKYVSPAAIKKVYYFENEIQIILKCGGIFAYYCRAENKARVNGKEVQTEIKNGLQTIDCSYCKEETLVQITIL